MFRLAREEDPRKKPSVTNDMPTGRRIAIIRTVTLILVQKLIQGRICFASRYKSRHLPKALTRNVLRESQNFV